MSHNYDDLVLQTGGSNHCTDYWRLDQDTNAVNNSLANLAQPDATEACGTTTTNLLPAANNYGACSFDGSSSYVTMTNAQLTQGSNFPTSPHNFSVEAWIQPQADQSTTDFTGIVVKNGCFGLCLNYGKPAFFTQLNGAAKIVAASSTAVSTSTNYHLVGTYNASTGDLKLYVNNSLVNTTNTGSTGDAVDHNASNLAIGSWDTSVLFFNGYISNVALYNITLSSVQVSAHYSYSG